MGSLQVVPINEGSVNVESVIRDVRTADPEQFVVPAVPLSVRVRLNRHRDFREFRAFVNRRGASFADDLLVELRNAVETLVRGQFARRRHDDLYGASVAALLKPGAKPLACADGLLLIESLAINGAVSWSQTYLDLKAAKDSTLVGLATNESDEVVGVDRAGVDARIANAQYREFAPLAEALGVPIEMFVNPEALANSQAAASEMLGKLLEPANRALIQRDPDLLARLLAASGITRLASTPRAEVTPATLTTPELGGTPVASLPSGMTDPGRQVDGSNAPFPAPDLDLTIDQRLARIWTSSGGSTAGLAGMAGDAAADSATVILVATTPIAVPQRFVDQAAALLRVPHVTVMALCAQNYEELGADWVNKALGDLASGIVVACDVIEAGGLEQLRYTLQGEPRRCFAAVARLNTPGLTARGAFDKLLPFASLDLEIGA